jgi:hypothetical protein
MPDITKTDQEPARWMTLKETVGQIQTLENCGCVAAQRRLKATIGAGIIPVKWADSEGAKDIPDPRYLQGTKLILSGTGLAHDSYAYRPLMVLRSAFLSIWQHGKSNLNPSKEVEISKHDATSDKHENEQAEWMTLVEAEEHIEVLQDCDSVEALRQLKEEIGDGIVAVKWADESTEIPDVRILKYSEMILTGPGFAHNGKIYEQLLVNRSDILRIWPGASDLVEQMPREQSNSKSGAGRPTKRDQIWTTLSEMRNQGVPIKGNRSKIAREVAKRNNRDFDEAGWSLRAVLTHVQKWQKENDPADPKVRK